MTEHPISPPPELVREWEANWLHSYEPGVGDIRYFVATRAAQWGADQELEACVEWAQGYAECGDSLRAARRPKLPSLKQQALMGLSRIESTGDFFSDGMKDLDTIRRALDLLPD
jgi:hypothetical protein